MSMSTLVLYKWWRKRTHWQESPPAWMQERHTARHIASAHYAALCLEEGGPHPDLDGGGVLHPVLDRRGVPHPFLDRGYPIQSWPGWGDPRVPPVQTRDGVPPYRPGKGIPTPLSAGWGTAPPPPWVWTDRRLWKYYLLHPSDAGGKNGFILILCVNVSVTIYSMQNLTQTLTQKLRVNRPYNLVVLTRTQWRI